MAAAKPTIPADPDSSAPGAEQPPNAPAEAVRQVKFGPGRPRIETARRYFSKKK